MRALVLGATGFLGTHVCDRAAAAGLAVVPASRRPHVGPAGCRQIDLATAGGAAVTALLTEVEPDVVINCAGRVDGTPAELAAANLTGPAALLAALIRLPGTVRLVHLGSSAEYGWVEPGVPVTERTAPAPVGAYGLAKLAGTNLVGLARAAGLDAVVLRVFNATGPGAPASSLPGMTAAQLRGSLATGTDLRLGPLNAVRDFVDARDVADAAIAAATAPELPHLVLNVGSGVGSPVRAVVDELVACSGFTGAVREELTGSVRSAAVPWLRADIGRALQDLGWRPRYDLATSLADLWHQQQEGLMRGEAS